MKLIPKCLMGSLAVYDDVKRFVWGKEREREWVRRGNEENYILSTINIFTCDNHVAINKWSRAKKFVVGIRRRCFRRGKCVFFSLSGCCARLRNYVIFSESDAMMRDVSTKRLSSHSLNSNLWDGRFFCFFFRALPVVPRNMTRWEKRRKGRKREADGNNSAVKTPSDVVDEPRSVEPCRSLHLTWWSIRHQFDISVGLLLPLSFDIIGSAASPPEIVSIVYGRKSEFKHPKNERE